MPYNNDTQDAHQLSLLGDLPTRPATSEHGPCADGGAKVRDALPDNLRGSVREWCLRRLDAGEQKYGAFLRVGWSRADEALAEEYADAINYAVAGGRDRHARVLADLLQDLGPVQT